MTGLSYFFALPLGCVWMLQGCVSEDINAECIQEAQTQLKELHPMASSVARKTDENGCHVHHTIYLVDSEKGKEFAMAACCDGARVFEVTLVF